MIEPAGSVYMPSGVAAIVMFLFSLGLLEYWTRATGADERMADVLGIVDDEMHRMGGVQIVVNQH